MNTPRLATLLAATFAIGIATGCSGGATGPHPDVAARQDRIAALVRDEFQGMACIQAPRLPRSERADCPECAQLAELGLIGLETARRAGEREWRPTPLGRRAYDATRARFCFGAPRLEAVLASTAPRVMHSAPAAVVSLRIAVDDAHPLLHDARLQALGLLAPEPGQPARFPPQCMTIELYPDGDVGLAPGQVARGVGFCRSYYVK